MYDIDYIAVPLDFSRSSRAALALARTLVEPGARIGALHVVQPWAPYVERILFPYAPLGEDAVEIERELVEAARAELERYHDLGEKDANDVLYGPVKPTLTEQLLRTPAQLVVAGATGETGPVGDTVGSVADRLVRSAARPTLLVRERDAQPQIGKVLVALDLTEGTERVFNVAVALAQRAGAELEVIHVVPDPLAQDQSQVLAPVLNFNPKQAASRSRDRVEALFDRLFRNVQPGYAEALEVREFARRRRVTIGDPATAIIEYAARCGADVLVVGHQDPRRPSAHLGRVADAVIRRAPLHVCVVPVRNRANVVDDD